MSLSQEMPMSFECCPKSGGQPSLTRAFLWQWSLRHVCGQPESLRYFSHMLFSCVTVSEESPLLPGLSESCVCWPYLNSWFSLFSPAILSSLSQLPRVLGFCLCYPIYHLSLQAQWMSLLTPPFYSGMHLVIQNNEESPAIEVYGAWQLLALLIGFRACNGLWKAWVLWPITEVWCQHSKWGRFWNSFWAVLSRRGSWEISSKVDKLWASIWKARAYFLHPLPLSPTRSGRLYILKVGAGLEYWHLFFSIYFF